MSISLELGTDVIRNYKRLSYKPWYALAEFIDNSTQCYFNNEDELNTIFEEEGEKLSVRVVYDRNAGFIRISDNALGMSYEELSDALKIGRPPRVTSGRSQFGLGLKTAACWFGNKWSVRTKKLGEEVEHEVTVDVEKVAGGDRDLSYKTTPKASTLHYTIIEIEDLNAKLHAKTVGKVKSFLRSMYRIDLREDRLALYWDDVPLLWDERLEFMTRRDGSLYRQDYQFNVDGRRVSGWLGILGPGSSGRPNAGFTIIRRGRVIRGYPDSWRPESIFGQLQGSNDLINQRITGEIHLDEFEVSHTKDDILWVDSQEEEVQAKLKEIAIDYIDVARVPRKAGSDTRGPNEAEIQAAVDELRNEMESPEFVDLIEIESVPPPEVIAESNRPMLESARAQEPRFVVRVGHAFVCRLFLATDASPMELYYNSEVDKDGRTISVVVNVNHPHWNQLGPSESVLTYLRQCVYDAIAEFQCRRKTGNLQSTTIKALKDALLRLPSRMEDASLGSA